MVVELELRIFKDGYLLNIQNTSGITLNRIMYALLAGINELYDILLTGGIKDVKSLNRNI